MRAVLAALCLTMLAVTPALSQPRGFKSFCDRLPLECEPDDKPSTPFATSPDQIRELDAVNFAVNAKIAPVTDLELYGVVEFWAIPTDKGDCEDYALLKRRYLIAKGWPTGSLLLTVVRDYEGEAHTVLTARTTSGDFILDNKTDALLPNGAEGRYAFLMRQSPYHPRAWERFTPTPSPQAADLWAVLLSAAFALVGIVTVAGWFARVTCVAIGIRTPAQRKAMEFWMRERDRIAKHYRDHHDADELDKMTDTWVGALERALDAMKDDPKLAKREIEYVLDELEERDAA